MFLQLFGCATQQNIDPLEGMNRSIYGFNDTVDNAVMKPVAKGYKNVMPDIAERGVNNFFNNIKDVITVINDLLQFKLQHAANDAGRVLVNTTVGILGTIDVHSMSGGDRRKEDFGQTLAVWGVGEGPYIMLPFLGPSTLRDTLSRPVSSFLSVTFHMTEDDVNIALKSIDALETRERLLDVESLLSGDKYVFVKDAYIQSMYYEIKDGIDVKDEFVDDMDDFLIDQ